MPSSSASVGAGAGDLPEAGPSAGVVATSGFGGLDGEAVRRFGAGEVLLFDGVLGRERARAVARDLIATAGDLTPAGIGRGADHRLSTGVRGDRTRWLARTAEQPLAALWTLFDRVAEELRRSAFLGVQELEVQLALYQAGASYLRHVDAFATGGRRRATAVVYLNEGWAPGDGGELRVVTPAGPRDVAPVLDRLVLYRSDAVAHEVLPVGKARWAVTAWFLGPLEVA